MSMNREPDMIIVQNIVKKYGNFTAVNGVNLTVKKGELFGLLGPNGAGKTTLLSMLSTTLKPSSGQMKVNGFDTQVNPEKVRQSIGMVFQDPSLDADLTARENLWMHAKMFHLDPKTIDERINHALNLVELTDVKDKDVKKFSGGMKRRLEIVRGLLHEPKVLFLDEPTLGLDPQTRRKMWEYIRHLSRKQGLTMILTTHYMEEADELCDQIAIIDKGKIVALGTPSELKKNLKGDRITIQTQSEKAFMGKDKPSFVKEVKRHEGQTTLTVDSAEKRVTEIVLLAKRKKITIESLTIQKPSLEDVFLHFTGRTIREAELDSGEQFAARVRLTGNTGAGR